MVKRRVDVERQLKMHEVAYFRERSEYRRGLINGLRYVLKLKPLLPVPESVHLESVEELALFSSY